MDLAIRYDAALDVLHALPPMVNPFVMDPDGEAPVSRPCTQAHHRWISKERCSVTYGDRYRTKRCAIACWS